MFDDHLKQLRNADPGQRRQAIIALANSNESRATEVLHKLSTSDPDVGLRDIAAKAEQHLRKKLAQHAAAPRVSSESPVAIHELSSSDAAQLVSDTDQERARSQVANAFGSRVNGDKVGALNSILHAISLDPNLRNDAEVKQLASELTGQPPDEAIPYLQGKVEKAEKTHTKKPDGSSSNSFGSVALNALIALVFLFVLTTGLIFLYLTLARDYPNVLARVMGGSSRSITQMRSSLTDMQSNAVFGTALLVGLVTLVASVIGYGVMYVGGLILGGTASIFEFITTMTWVQVVITVINVVIALLVTVGVRASPSLQNNLSSIVNFISLVSSIGGFFAYIFYAAKVNGFSFMRGCVTVFSPTIFACGLIFLLVFLRK